MTKIQGKNFPIGVQVTTGGCGENIMIMFRLCKSDILSELIEKGKGLFPELDNNSIKMVDLNLEEKGESNEKNPHFIYINGFDFK